MRVSSTTSLADLGPASELRKVELNTPLFYRGARGVTLTRAGERLLPYATQVARLLTDAEQAVLSDEIPRGLLRLGSMETTAALRLPKLLTTYARCYPEVDIELELGPTEAMIAAVLDRRVEAAFIAGPVNQKDLTAIPVLDEELVLVAGAQFHNHDHVLTMFGIAPVRWTVCGLGGYVLVKLASMSAS